MTVPTSKQRFLLSPHAEAHRKLAKSEGFVAALDAAMLEVLRHTNLYEQVHGAMLFRTALETIADEFVPTPPSAFQERQKILLRSEP